MTAFREFGLQLSGTGLTREFEASLAGPVDACFAPLGDTPEATAANRDIADTLAGDFAAS